MKKLNFIFKSKINSDILIKKSNLFYKNNDKELVTLLSSKDIKFEFDKKNQRNLITLIGKIFNTSIKIQSDIDYISKKK